MKKKYILIGVAGIAALWLIKQYGSRTLNWYAFGNPKEDPKPLPNLLSGSLGCDLGLPDLDTDDSGF